MDFSNIEFRKKDTVNSVSDAFTPEELIDIGNGFIIVDALFENEKYRFVGINDAGNIGYLYAKNGVLAASHCSLSFKIREMILERFGIVDL